jgi:hypothetical protein
MDLGQQRPIGYSSHRPQREATVKEELAEMKKLIQDGQKIEETKKTEKPFQFPRKWKGPMRRSLKVPNKILVFYLNKFGKIEPPKLLPVLDGDMVIIHEKPYEVNPKAIWRMGRYDVYLVREIDRRPVSNEDYDEVKARGDCTDSDVFLIKASQKAIQRQAKKEMSKAALIVIGVIIVGIVIFFIAKG